MAVRLSLEDTSQTYKRRLKEYNGDCSYCPYHDIENCRGSHSKYGKKKAAKSFYATGKGRKKPRRYEAHTWYQNLGNYTYKVLSV